MEKKMKLYLFLFIMIFSNKITLEIELNWKMVTQCATGITNIIKEEIEKEIGIICYRAPTMIAECPENSEEQLGPINIKPRSRACYEKCKENEVKISRVCCSCPSGKNLIIEKNHIGQKNIYCQDPISKQKTKAELNKQKMVKESHCMPNTTVDESGCSEDCGVIGLKPFDEFCASDEETYKFHKKKFYGNLIHLPFKIVSKLSELISAPAKVGKSDLGLLYDDVKEYVKLENFNTNKWHLWANIQTRLKIMGREAFSNHVNNYVSSMKDDYFEYAIKVCPLFSDSIFDDIISDQQKEITFEKGFQYYFKIVADRFLKFFMIDDFIDLNNACFQDVNNLSVLECTKSFLSLVEEFDPTPITAIYSTMISYYAEPCDIKVAPEYSEEILYFDQPTYLPGPEDL